jgi:hypothetical protein
MGSLVADSPNRPGGAANLARLLRSILNRLVLRSLAGLVALVLVLAQPSLPAVGAPISGGQVLAQSIDEPGCYPYGQEEAERESRSLKRQLGSVLHGIGKASSELWGEYLRGGVPDSNRRHVTDSGDLKEFRSSGETKQAIADLFQDLRKVLMVDRFTLGDPKNPAVRSLTSLRTSPGTLGEDVQLEWKRVFSLPANIAGGIGDVEINDRIYRDQRDFSGTITFVPKANKNGVLTRVTAQADLTLTVLDAIDLCRGDLGTDLEQTFTYRMRRLEVTPRPNGGGYYAKKLLFDVFVPFDSSKREMRSDVTDLFGNDVDSDNVPDQQPWLGATYKLDNCPRDPNKKQEDKDKDGIGDACDPDRDGSRSTASGRVFYRGQGGAVHELLLRPGSGWVHTDLTKDAKAPKAASDPVAYTTGRRQIRVIYRGTDNHIHELFEESGGPWHHEDLHKLAQIGDERMLSAAGDPSGYASPNPRVVYRGRDKHIHELFQHDDGQWVHVDLHDKAGIIGLREAEADDGDPSGYASPASRVVYRGHDNQIHEFFQHPDPDGRWVHAILTGQTGLAAGAPEARGNPMGYSSPSGARVVYRGAGKPAHVHELFQRPQDGTWVHADLHDLVRNTNLQQIRVEGDPWGFADPLARVEIRDSHDKIYQLVQEPNGDWNATNLHDEASRARAAKSRPSGYATPFFTDTLRVLYRNSSDRVSELFQGPDGWGHVDLADLIDAPKAAGDPVGLAVDRRRAPSVLIADARDEPVEQDGEEFLQRRLSLAGDGGFLLSGRDDGTGAFYVDDAMDVRVTRADGTTAEFSTDFNRGGPGDCSGLVPKEPLDLAHLLGPGRNIVSITFRDTCGFAKGNSQIWLRAHILNQPRAT